MTDDAATGRLVVDALERTRLRGSALIEFTFEASVAEIPAFGAPSERPGDGSLRRRSTGAMWRGALRIVFWGLRRVLERVTQMTKGVLGVLDLQGHRCVYYPKPTEAELVVGDQRWTGAPGTAVDRLPARAASALQPLWLIDLVGGVVEAREHPRERLDGRVARRFSARADLTRAGAAVSYEMAVPSGIEQLGDLERIRVDVWIDDDGYLRRIRHTSGDASKGVMTSTLELTELGVALPPDWSRIPRSFRGA